jgi:hypothetical protein
MFEGSPDVDRIPQNEICVCSGYSDVEHTGIFGSQAGDDRIMLRPNCERLSVLRLDSRTLDVCKPERLFKRRLISSRRRRIHCSLADIVEGPLDEVAEVGRLP